jgi:tubulin monoglycylase TTLL15
MCAHYKDNLINYSNNLLCHGKSEIRVPKYWLIGTNGRDGMLSVVGDVLNSLGLEKVENFPRYDDSYSNWNLIWSYHLNLSITWNKLKFHQKFNHFPGNHYLASKSVLGTTADSKYIPKAFKDIEKLKDYASDHPDKKFVLKFKTNRGVELKTVAEMSFNVSSEYFAQEFIENPLLFNGHKFDFAVYVLISSIDPLRVYYYTKNILMRFCPVPYDKNDFSNLDSYVVTPTNIPVVEFNGTREFYDAGYTHREAFEAFVRRSGGSVDSVWFQVEDCIRSIVMTRERHYIYHVCTDS